MRRSFGVMRGNGANWNVYESSERLIAGAGALALPAQITDRNFAAIFTESVGGARTTVVTSGGYRLDKQNNGGLVTFAGHANAYDNLSIQSGDTSLAVLYIEDGFLQSKGAQTDVAGLRALLLNADHGERNTKYLMRVLYTWLVVSNRLGFKICISRRMHAVVAAVPALAADPSAAIKARGQLLFP